MTIALITFMLLASGCACFNENTLYGFDGKALSWCEGKLRAKKLCKNHGGLKNYADVSYDNSSAECNDGTKFTGEAARY